MEIHSSSEQGQGRGHQGAAAERGSGRSRVGARPGSAHGGAWARSRGTCVEALSGLDDLLLAHHRRGVCCTGALPLGTILEGHCVGAVWDKINAGREPREVGARVGGIAHELVVDYNVVAWWVGSGWEVGVVRRVK